RGAPTARAGGRTPDVGRARRWAARGPCGEARAVSGAGTFLARIARDRRRRVEQMKLATPPHTPRAGVGAGGAHGRLERALRRGGASQPLKLLCEIKRASPSQGMLNESLDPVALARVYAAGGAAAISLVTEPDHFLGDLAWVNQV